MDCLEKLINIASILPKAGWMWQNAITIIINHKEMIKNTEYLQNIKQKLVYKL